MGNKSLTIFKCIVAVLILWACVLVGGTAVVYLFNFFSPARYAPDSFGYQLIGLLGGPIGVYLGNEVVQKLTAQESYVFRGVNLVVISVFCGCFILFGLTLNSLGLYNLLHFAATGIVAGVLAFVEFSNLRK